ncbi:MAG: L,D-transpeptidase family protein [Thermoleophilia bacterium]
MQPSFIRRPLALGAILALCGLTTAAAQTTAPATTQAPTGEQTVNVRMLAAAGNGTITVRMNGHRTTVRLLGISDPGAGQGSRAGCLRAAAKDAVTQRLPIGKSATLLTGTTERDAQGNLLAWAYPGGGSGPHSVSWTLVQGGFAAVDASAGQLRYSTELATAEATARKARNGRWGLSCSLGTVSGVQRRLIDLGYLPTGYVNNSLDYRTMQAVMAFQGWSGLSRVGTVDATTKKRLETASRPVPWSTAGGRHVEVHISQQVMLLVDGARVVRAIHVSTGRNGRTPTGSFHIYSRDRWSWSHPFHVTLPYAQYFSGGFAFHQYPDVPGYPASHGCVRLPGDEAAVVWGFGAIGMPVTVR